jgi:ATP-dependent DNA helicase RecG
MNIGRADQLGSGIRNLYTYTKLYSGGVPELIEGDIFKTIIPLASSLGKQANNERIKQAKKERSSWTTLKNMEKYQLMTSPKFLI